ncbi:MAG TPA: PEP-CTERM sorting domain-containing protein [Pirellulales bacterium]
MSRFRPSRLMTGVYALIACAACCEARLARGELYGYDGFDYPNDSPAINGLSGGTGWGGPWSDADGDFATLTMDDVSLSNPVFPYATTGDRVRTTALGASSEVNRLLPRTFDMSQDGVTLFASFLFQKHAGLSGATGNNVEFNFFASDGNVQVARVGGGSNDRFFLHNSTNYLEGSITLDQTYFLVLKVVSSALENDQYFLKVYDGTSPVPVAEPTEWDSTFGVNSQRIIDNVRFVNGANASGEFDELRVGSTWADVAGGATTPTGSADFDGDLDVDGADFLIWQRHFGTTGELGGDANDDSIVNGLDLDAWKVQYGGGGAGSVTGAAVPEPSSLLLAAGVAGAVAGRLRSRRK